jgi:hypothetical protein
MDLTSLHIAKIKSYEFDLHSKFRYETRRWKELNHRDQISDFEDREISRNDVLLAFQAYFSNQTDFIRPFLLTMIWGFSNAGYGTYRTNLYLSSEENKILIKKGINEMAHRNLKSAFKTLLKIPGLNISYLSKILYFAGKAAGIQDYPLIFDIRVSRALVKLVHPDLSNFLEILPSKKFEDYEKFNSFIHALAKKHDLEADALELFFFDGQF